MLAKGWPTPFERSREEPAWSGKRCVPWRNAKPFRDLMTLFGHPTIDSVLVGSGVIRLMDECFWEEALNSTEVRSVRIVMRGEGASDY